MDTQGRGWGIPTFHFPRFATSTTVRCLAESEKDGEPKSQVHEEDFKREEGWHEMSNIEFCIQVN